MVCWQAETAGLVQRRIRLKHPINWFDNRTAGSQRAIRRYCKINFYNAFSYSNYLRRFNETIEPVKTTINEPLLWFGPLYNFRII